MTPPPPPPPPDPDELASAIVDGLLPPEEAEAARRDPAVARWVDEIHRVRTAVRATPPSPPPAAIDHAVGAAVAAFDADRSAGGNQAPQHLRVVARPTDGSRARPAPPRRDSSSPGAWLAAAAVVLVVAGLVAAGIASSDNSDGDQASSDAASEESGGDDSAAAPAAADEGGRAEQDGAGEAEASTTALVPGLGPVADAAELQDQVTANLIAGRTAADSSDDGDFEASGPPEVAAEEACPGLALTGDPARGTQTFVAGADLAGQFVRVHLYEEGTGLQLVATDESCTDVVDEPYEG